jgi:D-alanyl-D-alanine carboxypeptidase/D-alanyl-D-alanine-endopeptidase (penicillin-binding protein 4)
MKDSIKTITIRWEIGIAIVALSSYFAYSRLRNSPKSALAPAVATDQPSRTAGDAALATEIDRVVNESQLKARWGVFVVSLKDERVLYSHSGDALFTPASNMKVYTTAVALDLLGADYRWRTSVYAAKDAEAGVIHGDLTLYGRGAPDLVSSRKGTAPSLSDLVDQLYQRGVHEVRGNIVGDSSYFRGDDYGLGWQWNDLQWYYGAEPAALTIDGNSVNIVIAPGSKVGEQANVSSEHGGDQLHIINNTTTGDRARITTVGIDRELSDNEVRVWGEFPAGGRSFGAFLSVHNPALWAATLFRQALIGRGIKVTGNAQSRDFRVAENEKFDPAKAVELATIQSESLGEAVRETNKASNNLYAELILRTVGKEEGAASIDENPRKKIQGDDEKGVALINSWLKNHNVPADTLAIRDGSGLSRLDLVTPESTARLLVAIAKTNSAQLFHDSLPVAGQDGTLAGRLSAYRGRIFAKTGTVLYVHSLSGYAVTNKREVLAFSIFCNDAIGTENPLRVIDQIAALIADCDGPHEQK